MIVNQSLQQRFLRRKIIVDGNPKVVKVEKDKLTIRM
jgi:hypothetical protein